MSYDIRLKHHETGETLDLGFNHKLIGGTYAAVMDEDTGELVPHVTECDLNVTYNYSTHYYRIFGADGIKILHGKTGRETLTILEQGISQLADDVDEDYWKPTEGNAKAALFHLRYFAEMKPDGVWEVS